MKRHIGMLAAALAVLLAPAARVEAQIGDLDDKFFLTAPSFDVRFSMGFNYDLLRSPTDVSFKYPVGYFGFNVPAGIEGDLQTVPGLDGVIDNLFDNDGMFRRGDNFRPNGGASQAPNVTVKVDVPMLEGVGSFGYTQNFYMNFSTAIGGTSLINGYVPLSDRIESGDATVDIDGYMSLRGAVRIPLAVNLTWETMTFGYAYRVAENDDLIFAYNLHRHLFAADIRARADIDLLSHLSLRANAKIKTTGKDSIDITLIPPTETDIVDFASDKCNGSAMGRYRAEVWTHSFGARLWRFTYAGRLGIDTRVKGSLNGRFAVPAILDLQTGDFSDQYRQLVEDIEKNPMNIIDTISSKGLDGLVTSEIDSIVYETTEDMIWKMPQGHTLSFDIVRNRFSVSYTKLWGEVSMRLDNIHKKTATRDPDKKDIWKDIETIGWDMGVAVDHIIMLHLNYPSFFLNMGVFGFDGRYDSDHIDGGDWPKLGKGILLPVLNGGVTLGTKIQLKLEADILPLPAVRTGFYYYF